MTLGTKLTVIAMLWVLIDIAMFGKLLAEILAGGKEIEAYFGHATCRICGVELGHRDLGAHFGPYLFIWPEKAEHYILEHDVWTNDCQRMLDFAKVDS